MKIAFGSSGFRHRFPKKQELWFGHNDEDLRISTGICLSTDIRNEPHAFLWTVRNLSTQSNISTKTNAINFFLFHKIISVKFIFQ